MENGSHFWRVPIYWKIPEIDRKSENSSFFWKFCPGRSIHSRPGDPYVHCPGDPSFFQCLHLKEDSHFFPNFTEAGSCVFVFQLFPEPPKNFQKCWQLENPFITKFYSSWKTIFHYFLFLPIKGSQKRGNLLHFYYKLGTHLLVIDPGSGNLDFSFEK